ncbi:MAG: serine hydrolase domain-containing protein [Clostridia bacterium]
MNHQLLEHRLDCLTKAYKIPAWGFVVYHHQREVFRRLGGYSDYAATVPTAKDDVYWLYSMTKLATCAAAMRLWQEGKLRLEDEVSAYLPAFANVRVKDGGTLRPPKTPLTVFHLFTMTGGLDYDNAPLLNRSGDAATQDALVNAIAEKPLLFDPGTQYLYSLSHDVLTGVIASASGMPYEQYLQTTLFAPLGMTETRFLTCAADCPRLSAQYQYQSGAIVPYTMENNYVFSPAYRSGGAGLCSTLDDYILLLNALANGGVGANGARILAEESVREMTVNRLNPAQQETFTAWRPGYGYGLGVRTRVQDASNPEHCVEFGWDGAAGAYGLMDLGNHLAVLYMQHVRFCAPANSVHNALRETVYEALRT